MTPLLIILIIIFSLLCVIIVFFALTSILKKDQIKSSSGIFLLDIDLQNNRLRKSTLVEEVESDNNYEYFDEGWMDIDLFLLGLTEENKEKFLTAFDVIKLNKNYVKFMVKNKSLKESNYSIQWIVEFFKTADSISATIEWSYVENMPIDLKIINKEELFENDHKYKSFIAFNLKESNQKNFQTFIMILYENLKLKNQEFFVSKNIVILIVYGDSTEEVEKKISLIMKKIEKNKISKQLLYYYDSIGIIESDGVFDSKDLLKIINRIYFSLIKSMQLKKPFYFNIKNIFYNEFEEFKENYLILNNIIKSKNIKSKEIPILETKTGNVIAHYIKPDPQYPDNFWTNMIIDNKNILPNLEDSYFNKMLNGLNKLDQYLIDVNDYELVKNMDRLKDHSSMIFIIKFLESTDIKSLELVVLSLKRNNIKFGIKIQSVIPEVITLIESIMPHAIIIDEKLINSSDLMMFLNLKQLIFLCKKNPATLIFENPSEFELDKKEISYYYNNK